MCRLKLNLKQQKTLNKLGVILIYLFGSRAEGVETPSSDTDIGVVFADPEQYRDNTLTAYVVLDKLLSELMPEASERLDVVFLQLTTLSLQLNAIRNGQLLYQRSQDLRYQYEEDVIRRHADFHYYSEMHNRAIMARI